MTIPMRMHGPFSPLKRRTCEACIERGKTNQKALGQRQRGADLEGVGSDRKARKQQEPRNGNRRAELMTQPLYNCASAAKGY